MTKRTLPHVERVKRKLIQLLTNEPGFVGVGISMGTSGHYEIIVLVKDAGSLVLDKAPQECEGIPVRTQIAGTPRKF